MERNQNAVHPTRMQDSKSTNIEKFLFKCKEMPSVLQAGLAEQRCGHISAAWTALEPVNGVF